MLNNKRILAIIPARGGSKGIPHKNIADLCGKPLIAYTIEEAKKSKYIDYVLISTDDEKIKEKAIEYGGNVPFIRPKNLSDDKSKSIDVVIHSIDYLKNQGNLFDYVILLQPTSPLRNANDIDEALEKVIFSEYESLVSVSEVDENPILMGTIEENKFKKILNISGNNVRRQEFPKVYIYNGAIYINSVEMLYREKVFVNDLTVPYVMPKERSMDIDEQMDLDIVEFFIKEKKNVWFK